MTRPSPIADRFVGIDFSGARGTLSNLWSATGIDRGGKLHLQDLRPHPFREDLAAWLIDLAGDGQGHVLAGADFPFSVPSEAARRLVDDQPTWHAVLDWVQSHPPDDLRDACEGLHKTTRSIDPGQAMAPLDLRLYKQTAEGMKWLHHLRQEAGAVLLPFDEPAGDDPSDPPALTLIEVYPSGTAGELNIRGRKPSRAGQVRARPQLLEPFVTFEHPSLEAAAVTLEDAWDATLAAVTAHLVRGDLDQPQRSDVPDELVTLEGWVYKPMVGAPDA